jgi:hypothetical protein
MKNAVKYYYRLEVDEIHQVNEIFEFKISNEKYMLCPYKKTTKEASEIYELQKYLNIYRVYSHKIILNVKNSIITEINEEKYILIKNKLEDRIIDLSDILYLTRFNINPQKFPLITKKKWRILWANKNDYIEYQMSQIGKIYPILRESMDYHIGIAETCIELLNDINIDNYAYTIGHDRLYKNITTKEFYNPLNFILDNRSRDIGEFIKNIDKIEEQIKNIELIKKSNTIKGLEYTMMFTRLMYPSIYFDIYEQIIEKKYKKEEFEQIVKNIENEEKKIKKIYRYINDIYIIPKIEWLSE